MNSELDVLVVGGYGLIDNIDGSPCGAESVDPHRLTYKGKPVSLAFIKHLMDSEGDLAEAEQSLKSDPQLKQFPRQLNTVYLYDFLSRNGYRTEAINYYAYERAEFERLMTLKPRVLALSTTFIADPALAVEIARRAKDISPDTLVMAGGIKVLKSARQQKLEDEGWFADIDRELLAADSFFYDAAADAGIDLFVIDESGLQTLDRLMQSILAGQNWHTIPNLAFWEGQSLIFTERQPEKFSFTAHTVDWSNIPEHLIGHEIPVRAGVGCPFKCAFCDFAGLVAKCTLRPIDDVIKELKQIQELFPGKPVFFTDDNLFVNKKRTRELCEGIIQAGLKFPWRAFFRVDAVDDDVAELAAQAGCTMAMLGVESGDRAVLNNMDKRCSPDLVLQCVDSLDRQGIDTMSFIVVGFPGETRGSVSASISLLQRYPRNAQSTHVFYPFVFSLLPLSPAASPAGRERYGITGLWNNWSHATMDYSTAKEEYLRLTSSVTVPLLQYPEPALNGMGPELSLMLMRARQELVKMGVNRLTADNAREVHEFFRQQIDATQTAKACA